MKATRILLQHPHFDADDHAYLVAKGWTIAMILSRWNGEGARGAGPCRWDGDTARAKLAAVTARPAK